MLYLVLHILIILAIICVIFAAISWLIDRILRAKGYHGPTSDHFDGRKFHSYPHPNPVPQLDESLKRGIQFAELKWLMNRPKSDWKYCPNVHVPQLAERMEGGKIVVTFVNHSTMLIQTEGLNIITDPIWALRASPFPFLGPKRFRDPGIAIDSLPPIDIILLSHNHYDHMDIAALRRIAGKWHPKIFTSLGNSEHLAARGIANAVDMDWWDELPATEEIGVLCVPAQHFAARALSDRNNTLWAGFVLRTPHGSIYFAGDTAYDPFLEAIKGRMPQDIRLAFLPIGAYKPEWFMSPVHQGPDQAFAMHHALGIKTSIGIHFGTFHLADDGQDEAPNRIKELVAASEGEKPDFRVLDMGESVTIE